MMIPLFEHDCDKCVFLGTYDGKDLYFCAKTLSGRTVIARSSSEGGDYMSGMVFADSDIHLGVAKFIANRMGLIK